MHRIYGLHCFLFFIFSTSHAMFMHDLLFNTNNNIEVLKTLQFDISFLKNKSSVEPRIDEILLPGDFPIISLNKTTIKKLKIDGKKIIHDAENFIQEKKQDINAIFEILPAIEKHKKRQGKLLELRKNKLSTENNLILEVPKKQSITSWESVKKNKGSITVVASLTIALVLFMLKKIHAEKTDNELLQELNDIMNVKRTKENWESLVHAKVRIVRRIMYRLIDREKETPFALLKGLIDHGNMYENHQDLIVIAGLYRNRWSDCTSFSMDGEEKHKPFYYFFCGPETEKKEEEIKLLLQLPDYQKMFAQIPQCYKYQDDENDEFGDKIEKYMILLMPLIRNRQIITKALFEVEGSIVINPDRYKQLQKLLLENGAMPDCAKLLARLVNAKGPKHFGCKKYPSFFPFSEFVQSRIDSMNILLCYGGKIDCTDTEKINPYIYWSMYPDEFWYSEESIEGDVQRYNEQAKKLRKKIDHDYAKKIEDQKKQFMAIRASEFRHVSEQEAKDTICNALDTIAINIGKEKEFREHFFNYSHQKKHNQLLETLCQNYPRPAWWILRVLNDRSHDMAITDMSHIPPFCFKQMNNLFKDRSLSDDDMEKEMRSWNDLILFLLSKTPRIFKHKEVHLEKPNGELYTVPYKDQKTEIDRLPLRIVEQGFYEKPKTYKLLLPLLEYCIMNNEFIPDISVQNGNEGSIIHLFAWNPFDMDMIKQIFKTYQVKDPTALYMACSKNNKKGFSDEFSTPEHIAKNNMLKMCEEKYIKIIEILQNEAPTLKKASAHCPQVDTVITNLSSREKTIEWQVNHCPNI